MQTSELKTKNNVGFGTSGVRGLVTDMTDYVCYAYTAAFLQYTGTQKGDKIAVAGDLRASTPRIMRAVSKAIIDAGGTVVNGGNVPSPAVANYGLTHKIPAIMVTGSHIPDDRNGIKFNTASGEISKEDETSILAQELFISNDLFDSTGNLKETTSLPEIADDVRTEYIQRYTSVFPRDFLTGKNIAVYAHSAVGRDILLELYEKLGANVTEILRSDIFIPVDTEAIRKEDIELAKQLAHKYDAILSTDGDSDRPLIADENGEWFRGDILGILTAKYLNANGVATPVSCNTALEKSEWFKNITRTPIGSPYVIAAMNQLTKEGIKPVVGYEANGGFLINTPIQLFNANLAPLPTRDPVIVHLAILGLAKSLNKNLSELNSLLPNRITYSDRLQNIDVSRSEELLKNLKNGQDIDIIAKQEDIVSVDLTDGARFTLNNGDIVHLRKSGNAPELRCYAESSSQERVKYMVEEVLGKLSVIIC